MTKFEIYEFIKRPPQDVFDYFSNPANLAEWQSNTESCRMGIQRRPWRWLKI